MNVIETPSSSVNICSLQIQNQGQITIPPEVLNTLQTHEGDTLNLIQIGDLIFLTARPPQVEALTQQFVELMEENQVTLDELLEGLQQERQALWQERQNHA
ncbi:MAG: AbrB/MazE/SpoVT family DNA-binding domain-containing protein [Snowella sp.]|nr:AbrB/MazE/SpoVT family DNA-binding domain-containing protein [Snowella sp.]